MIRTARYLFLFTITLLLVTSCNVPFIGTNQKGATPAPTASTVLPPLTSSDVCPRRLRLPATCQTPHSLRINYGIESLISKGYTGKGQTVVDIVSFGSPTLKQDMDVFDSTFGLPPVDLQVISPLNVPESDPHHDKEGWASETTLDVQIIHAIAPDARIVILVSPVAETEGTLGLPEFRQLEQYAIDNKLGTIVSHSWGVSELTLTDAQGQQEMQKWNDLLQKATTQQNITFVSSSGDNGATDYADLEGTKIATVRTTSFPADSPWVTAIGGTNLKRKGTAIQETAWNGSGGGFSHFYQMPSYQKTLPATTQQLFQNRRGIPDVSAVADPLTGLAIYQDNLWTLGGGTSASTPVWAGLIAIANQMAGHSLGFIDPALYKLATSDTYQRDFRDITQGNNTNSGVEGYPAVSGWDPVTGLGAPNAEHLLPDLIAAMK